MFSNIKTQTMVKIFNQFQDLMKRSYTTISQIIVNLRLGPKHLAGSKFKRYIHSVLQSKIQWNRIKQNIWSLYFGFKAHADAYIMNCNSSRYSIQYCFLLNWLQIVNIRQKLMCTSAVCLRKLCSKIIYICSLVSREDVLWSFLNFLLDLSHF